MSALGQKQTYAAQNGMSALPLKRTLVRTSNLRKAISGHFEEFVDPSIASRSRQQAVTLEFLLEAAEKEVLAHDTGSISVQEGQPKTTY